MQPGDIPLEVVEAVAAGAAGAVKVDAVEPLHNIDVVGYLEVGDRRLAEALDLHIFAVIPADRNRGVNEIGDHQHPLADFPFELFLEGLQLLKLPVDGGHLRFGALGLLLLALGHQSADLLADRIALAAQLVAAGLGVAVLLVLLDNLIDKDKLLILEFLFDVLLDQIGIGSQQFDV